MDAQTAHSLPLGRDGRSAAVEWQVVIRAVQKAGKPSAAVAELPIKLRRVQRICQQFRENEAMRNEYAVWLEKQSQIEATPDRAAS